MTIAYVQTSALGNYSNVGTSGTETLSLTGTTAGNRLILAVSWLDSNSAGVGLSNLSDGVNTWNNATTFGDSYYNFGHLTGSVYSAYIVSGGTITVTMTNTAVASASSYWKCQLLEFSGIATSSANDGVGNAGAGANSTGPLSCTGGTLSSAGDLLISLYGANSAESGLATPSGFTSVAGPAATFPSYGFAYKIATSNAPVTSNWGTNGTAFNWVSVMSAYNPAGGGGGGGVTNHGMLLRGCQ